MDQDGSCGRPAGRMFPGDGPPTEPIPVIPSRLEDRWDPAWDADWWNPIWDALRAADAADPVSAAGKPGEVAACAAGTAKPGIRPDGGSGAVRLAMAGHAGPAPAPETSATATVTSLVPAEPSWGRIVGTTISLWVSRRLPGVGLGWRRGAGRGNCTWFRLPHWELHRPSVHGARLMARGSAARGSRARLLAGVMLGAGLLAAGAGTAGLVMASGSSASPARLAARPSPVAVPSGRTGPPVWLATVQQTARPVWLTVPAIGVRAAIVDLGLNRNGALQVPGSTTVVGWYTGSPRPGAIGSAVIAGHVDSRAGPAVFFWLRTMRSGEHVYVRRADGTLAVFTVTSVQMYPKDKFPTAAVYGPVPDAELRLITCGGTFDESLRSYLSNVVVYARLTG
jgi:Sortase domain